MALLATMLGGCLEASSEETKEHCAEQLTNETCTASEAESGHSCYWVGCGSDQKCEACQGSGLFAGCDGTLKYCSSNGSAPQYSDYCTSDEPSSCPEGEEMCSVTCTEPTGFGRMYSTDSGVLVANVVAAPSSKGSYDGNRALSGDCDWSSWPADSSLEETKLSRNIEVDDVIIRHYQRAGLAEHASVASFSRAVLELMEHGAPAGLIDRTLVAAREEIRHAQMALALASSWSAVPLRVTGINGLSRDPAGGDLVELAKRTINEACAGETPAALKALVGHQLASDGPVRRYLSAVVAEERSHAELAWATAGWTLVHEAERQAKPAGQGRVPGAIDEALSSVVSSLWMQANDSVRDPAPKQNPGLLRAGIVPKELEAAVARIAAPLVERLRSELLHPRLLTGGLPRFELVVRQQFDQALEEARRLASDYSAEEEQQVTV